MSEEGGGKNRGVTEAAAANQSSRPPPPPNYYYGTFQGVANYPPQPPPPPPPPPANYSVVGFPHPAPPPVISGAPPVASGAPPHYHPQIVTGYVVVEGRPHCEERLPCCGIGLGWFLFILGFFLGAIPWYIGAFLLLCVRMDHREKPGLIACVIGSLVAALTVTLSVTEANRSW